MARTLTGPQREMLSNIAERQHDAEPYPFTGHDLRTCRSLAARGLLVEIPTPERIATTFPNARSFALTAEGAAAYDVLPEQYRHTWDWTTAREAMAEAAEQAERAAHDGDDAGDTGMPTGRISSACLHNLIGWDILTRGGAWLTVREVEHRHLGDTHVRFVGAGHSEWSVFSGDVTIRPPRSAVDLTCGHVGYPGTNPEHDETRAFCWLGCFRNQPVVRTAEDALPVLPAGQRVTLAAGHQVTATVVLGERTGTVVRTWYGRGWRPGDMLSLRSARPGRWYEIALDGTGEVLGVRPRELSPTDVPDPTGYGFPVVYEVEQRLATGRGGLDTGTWMHVEAGLTGSNGYDPDQLDVEARRIAAAHAGDLPVRVTVQVPLDVTAYAIAYQHPKLARIAA